MSKTLVTADLHFSANPRDEYRWLFLEKTLPTLTKEHKIDRILILGDLTEQKDAHPAALVNRLVDGLTRLAEAAHIYVLKANHDYKNEDVPFFRFLRHIERIRWINEPTALNLRGLGRCLFLPHTRDFSSWMSDSLLADDRNDWYFCHQTFDGANLGGRKAGGGAAPFPRDARVVSGDVHVPQKLGPVTYVGAPYLVDFGDDYEPRVLLLEGTKMKSIPVPGPQKRIVGGAATRKGGIIFSGNAVEVGDVVKVRVVLDRSEVSRAAARRAAREWADRTGVHLHAVEVVAPKTAPLAAARSRSRASDADLVRAYAKKMKKGRTTEVAGLKIAEEVT